MKLKKVIRYILIAAAAIGVITAVYAMIINGIVLDRGGERIIELNEWERSDEEKYDCILVLGAGIRDDGTPSNMLEDRLKTAIRLYELGVSELILVSGDHGSAEYNEVDSMQTYLLENGIPSEAMVLDHAGFSTYESIYRAKEIFCAEHVVIVTQKYHLYRALYTADAMSLDADGVAADLRAYRGEAYRQVREILARNKDFLFSIFKPEPTYLGETQPIK